MRKYKRPNRAAQYKQMLDLAMTAKLGVALKQITENTNDLRPSLLVCYDSNQGPQVLEGDLGGNGDWEEVKYGFVEMAAYETFSKRVIFTVITCISRGVIHVPEDGGDPHNPPMMPGGIIEALMVAGSLSRDHGIAYFAPIERDDGKIRLLNEPRLHDARKSPLLRTFWRARGQAIATPAPMTIIPPGYKGRWN